MHLVRDVLDNQLVRADGHRLGKVDGLVIELQERAPPRVACIETGADVLARRLGPHASRWMAALRKRLGGDSRRDIARIPWNRVRDVGVDIEIEIDETSATQLQSWLLRHVIGRLPGGMR
jgi:sporulation protein YlmC with PRC-barrel domain